MELKNEKLKTTKNALQYAVMHAPTEAETAEFALLLVDVETAIAKEAISSTCNHPFPQLRSIGKNITCLRCQTTWSMNI